MRRTERRSPPTRLPAPASRACCGPGERECRANENDDPPPTSAGLVLLYARVNGASESARRRSKSRTTPPAPRAPHPPRRPRATPARAAPLRTDPHPPSFRGPTTGVSTTRPATRHAGRRPPRRRRAGRIRANRSDARCCDAATNAVGTLRRVPPATTAPRRRAVGGPTVVKERPFAGGMEIPLRPVSATPDRIPAHGPRCNRQASA